VSVISPALVCSLSVGVAGPSRSLRAVVNMVVGELNAMYRLEASRPRWMVTRTNDDLRDAAAYCPGLTD